MCFSDWGWWGLEAKPRCRCRCRPRWSSYSSPFMQAGSLTFYESLKAKMSRLLSRWVFTIIYSQAAQNSKDTMLRLTEIEVYLLGTSLIVSFF